MSRARYFLGCVLLGTSSVFAAGPTLSEPGFVANQFQFRLSGETGQPYIIQASRNLTNWSGVLTNVLKTNSGTFTFAATNTSEYFRAKVGTPLFSHAVSADIFDPGSYAVLSDSFDSADPLFSTAAGQYDPLKRRGGGDIASHLGLTIGANSQIAGKIWTGPQAGVSLGPSVSVGSLSWVDSGQTGIQPGYWNANLQESWPEIRPPYVAAMVPTSGTVDGELYNYVFANGDYAMSPLRLTTGKILVMGKCRLYVTHLFSLSSDVVVRFHLVDSTLHLYLFATEVQFRAQVQGVVNANQFIMFGMPTCVLMDISVPSFTGVICAPSALCSLSTTSFVGACTARAVRLNRSVSFHFDENLSRVGGYY